MKKLLSILLAISLVFCLAGCGNEKVPTSDDSQDVAFTLLIKINPAVQASFNKALRCVKIGGTNTEGKAIADKLDVIGDDLETTTKEIIDTCKEDKFFENNDKVSFEIGIEDSTLNKNDVANNAKDALNKALSDLKIDATVEETTTNTNDVEINDTTSTTTTTSKPTSSKNTTVTTSKPTTTPPSTTTTNKPTTTTTDKPTANTTTNNPTTPPKPSGPSAVNPNGVKLEEEYVGQDYFVYDAENIYAPGICFYNDGGFGEGIYCILLDAMFTNKPDDDIKNRTPVTYKGVKYYRCGSGMSPAYVNMTNSDITITQDSKEIKAVLLSDGTLKITKSNHETFPVNTVLSISWNYLS